MPSPPGLPPIFEHAPVDRVSSQIIAEFPANTFLESIAIDAENTLFVTSHFDGKILRITPNGAVAVYAEIAGKATGLTFASDGTLLLTGWDANNVSTVFKIASDGSVETLVTLPDAMFLNGLTPLDGDRFLLADSYRGAIWELELGDRAAKIWLEHPLLARSSPDKEFPAVNGLKQCNGVLYASNTEQMLLIKIPIQPTLQAGNPEVFLSNVNLDDFAFDEAGNLYGTTHIYNSVVKITPDGSVTTIAAAEQGLVGSTALAFGRTEGDRATVYVVTNGGMSFPPPTGLEPAKVVRLDVGINGLPLQ